MARLLINPGTPQAWEIQLKPGTNRLGRGDQNDFQVSHASVSTAHCEIVLSGAGALIKDLGSTNGTFINRAPIQEAILQSGQHLQLGAVDMIFESAVVGEIAAPSPGAPPIPPPVTAPARTGGLRIAGAAHAPAATRAPSAPVAMEPEGEPPLAPPVAAPLSVGAAFCKFHPKTPARFLCNKCHKYFCDMCVTTRATSAGQTKTCRACGVEVIPVRVNIARPVTRGFFSQLPGTFIYPFRGFGIVILICATIAFAVLGVMSAGMLSIFAKIVFYGFLFLFMQNIIHSTTADETEPLSFPSGGDLIGAAFQLGGTILISFGLAIGLLVARMFDVDIPGSAIIATTLLGCLYFPMAFLAVAMKDSVFAANPLVVIPAIFKIPLEYLVTAIVLMSVFGVRQLGSIMSGVAGMVSLSTKDMSVLFIALGVQAAWAFGSVYLLTVNMRILGVLYNTKKHKLGWFSH